MRLILPFLLLAACSQQPASPPQPDRQLYVGQGRDRLCISGGRAGFVSYGSGDANCSAKGRFERSRDRLTFLPAGDADCRIEGTITGKSIRLGERSEACAYYCGPDADYSGRTFTAKADASPAVDFAGDPLC